MASVDERDEGFLFGGRELKELFAIFEGDDLVLLSMNEEEGGLDLLDVVEVWETITKEEGDARDNTESAEEGGDEDEAAMFFF